MLTQEQKEAVAARKAELMAPIIDRYQHDHGIDASVILKAFESGKFSYSATKRSLMEAGRAQRLTEAILTSQMSDTIALTMMNAIVDDFVQFVPIYKGLAEESTSNALDELYPEEWTDDMPIRVGETEEAPESRVIGGNLRIRNYEYARELAIPKRLFDRDKMGQAKRAASEFGKKFEQVKDKAWVWSLIRAGNTSNLGLAIGQVPPSNMAGQTTSFTTTAGPITPQRIEDALTAPAYFVDPFNNVLTVEFDTVLVDSFDRFKTMRFVDSIYTSTAVPAATDMTAQTAGPFSNNVLKGAVTVAASQFVKSARAQLGSSGYPWVLMQAGRGAIMQTVHDLEVEQEAPNAGKSHDQRSYRWQAVIEFGTGVRSPRVFFWGN
jgi:hypothetical protein